MSIDVKMLVELLSLFVVHRMRVDKTAPDPNSPRVGWDADRLVQMIDSWVVVCLSLPAVFADVGRLVFEQVKDLPEMAALARLIIFRGKRMLPLDRPAEYELVQMAVELEKEIALLPDGPRKRRLQLLFNYNCGVFCDACGRFDLAATIQEQSRAEAAGLGDSAGAAVAAFCAAFYQLKYLLCQGDAEGIKKYFDITLAAFGELVKATRGSSLEMQWGSRNGPVQMIEICAWLDLSPPQLQSWVDTARAATEKVGTGPDSVAAFVAAIDKVHHNDPQAEDALRALAEAQVQGSAAANELVATGLLILVRRALAAGRREEAQEFVGRMNAAEQGAQHVLAIARRLLTATS